MPTPKILPHNTDDWKGYTIDELRYMRAYTAARIEISRDRLTSRVSTIKKNGLTGGNGNGGSIVSRMLGAMGYVDMALIGWKVFSQVFRIFRLFRRY